MEFANKFIHGDCGEPETKESQPVPRHSEINESLAKSIIKKLNKA